jgi:hypothetical protein
MTHMERQTDTLQQIDNARRNRNAAIFGSWRANEESRRKVQLMLEAATAFGALNEWRMAPHAFSLTALRDHKVRDAQCGGVFNGYDAGFVDHPQWFREIKRPYRAAAIVAHLYGPGDVSDWAASARVDMGTWAARNGLTAHVPTDTWASWYFPGVCLLVVYTRPGVVIQWLPEQCAGLWANRTPKSQT